MPAPPLTTTEIAELAVSIRRLLSDPDFGMTVTTRQRWEGALACLEFVLGEAPRLALGGHRRVAEG
ncbi:MAG: hypothetical protein ACLQK4_16450 [Acidimicrobiales bacterium]